jgi:N-acetylmuramoyl-L-alanine amidase
MDYKKYIESMSHFVSESEIPQFENNTVSDTNSIIYKVQILSSKKQLKSDDEAFKKIEGVEELNINDTYKYTVGNETDYNKIERIKEKVTKYFPDAFIIATKNGKRITIQEALKKENP